ncbi:MAG: hypothetical protein QOG85_1229 [Gaiellaceae bacterium]|nr:hypothetical protein [Gaiellaceae bacterium]
MTNESPLAETVPGPVVREQIEPRWFGVPARFVLLCVGCAAVGAAIGLFVASAWGWGVAALLVAIIAFGALREAVRQKGSLLPEQSTRLALDGRSQAKTTAEVWRTQVETSLVKWRTRTRLNEVALARAPALQDLGAAVRSGDRRAANEASKRLDELDEQERSLEADLQRQLEKAKERIRLARLPVDETVMVTPNEPSAPYPPPDEADPPTPAIVPEPSPPPDEGTPPEPAPVPDDAAAARG